MQEQVERARKLLELDDEAAVARIAEDGRTRHEGSPFGKATGITMAKATRISFTAGHRKN